MVDLSSSLCKHLPEGKTPFSNGFPINTSIFLWFSYGFPMGFPIKTSIFSLGFQHFYQAFFDSNPQTRPEDVIVVGSSALAEDIKAQAEEKKIPNIHCSGARARSGSYTSNNVRPPFTKSRSVGVHITPMSRNGLWHANNELVTGAYKSTYNWGASHCNNINIYVYIYIYICDV